MSGKRDEQRLPGDLLRANRANWDERTALHLTAYPVDAFRQGASTLRGIELAEVGPVEGKTLLHLQCHFGLDTLSWARLGAEVTGIDFSEAAIAAARSLAGEMGLDARFVCSDIYALPETLTDQFDIVFASYGVLTWLPDIRRWAEVAARFVRPGGFLYLVDGHPLNHLIDDSGDRLRPNAGYFDRAPERVVQHGSYVGAPTAFAHPVTYQWQHTLGDITSAVIDAGLRLEFLREWPLAHYQAFPSMERGDDRYWHLPGDRWPLLFSLRARRPADGHDPGAGNRPGESCGSFRTADRRPLSALGRIRESSSIHVPVWSVPVATARLATALRDGARRHIAPSGEYRRGSLVAEEPQVEITVSRNGPYRITGPLKLVDHQGNELELDGDEIFLCRCGHSNNKPFCDGTHRTVGFRGPISEAVKKKGEKAVQGDPLP